MDFSTIPLSRLNAMHKNTLMETLSIQFTDAGLDFLEAEMPVGPMNHQPMGLLHGGATAALIESIGSMGSALMCDLSMEHPVGLEVNANHISSISEGVVVGKGKLIHKGKKTHVWQVDVYAKETTRIISSGRLTVMIVRKTGANHE